MREDIRFPAFHTPTDSAFQHRSPQRDSFPIRLPVGRQLMLFNVRAMAAKISAICSYAAADADVLVTSAPYLAKPRDVQVQIAAAEADRRSARLGPRKDAIAPALT
ncbi:hypothetical protein I6F30_24190 [Bradyrhizobium sp. NBAIM20]|uniref:hypothetical protein n=1 Tax=unclassified Bradyrhizobium TaxID=2631580 RepID=UPI001CD2C495|nr:MULTISPECIES: hypothetical protein [unclassified Bradyrhizobium]MCA1414228.1 hypothetical protein [Bradyrhizobium sp. NBAIM20]MCA1460611.1 hypothetical protein [Bradyrhizobium sp. NBAIM18]